MSETVEHDQGIKRAVFAVKPCDVSATWANVVDFFKPIFATSRTHEPNDVRDILLTQKAQLWVQWNITEAKIEAAFVTEFIGYPMGVWIRLWLGGAAHDAKVDYQAVERALTNFARQNSCRGFEIVGRHGWLRKFPSAVVEGLCLRTTFDE